VEIRMLHSDLFPGLRPEQHHLWLPLGEQA
jgi:hypothetical protein